MTATPVEVCLHILIDGTVLALFSLLAMWAVVSHRPHWFFRYAILLAAIALLLPIDADDVAVFFLFLIYGIIGRAHFFPQLFKTTQFFPLFRHQSIFINSLLGLESLMIASKT